MDILPKSIALLVASLLLLLCGCATTGDDYHDEKEFSDIPWNVPQQWEGSRQLPGMSPGY